MDAGQAARTRTRERGEGGDGGDGRDTRQVETSRVEGTSRRRDEPNQPERTKMRARASKQVPSPQASNHPSLDPAQRDSRGHMRHPQGTTHHE